MLAAVFIAQDSSKAVALGLKPPKHQEIYSITILQTHPLAQHQLPAFLSGPRLERGAGAAAAHPGRAAHGAGRDAGGH